MTTNILTIRFDNDIRLYEVSLFRGAVINSLRDKLLLFHNHDGKKMRYNYPLIQYKRIGGKAVIVCLKQGTEQIGELFSSSDFSFHLGERQIDAQISDIMPSRYNIQVWDKNFNYRIRRWIPFNSENYGKFKQIEGNVERTQFLERILTGNILSFAKGLGIHLEGNITTKIIKLGEPFLVKVKGTKVACYNADFMCNVSIPNYIGLGKHVSIGFGIITHKHNDNENN